MVKVTIAGGTGDVGQTMLEVIKDHPQHEVVVLTLKSPKSNLGVQVVVVDFADVASLIRVLEENDIHTVICALGNFGNGINQTQLNLMRAYDASSKTKRFVPSCFATASHPPLGALRE